MRPKEFKELMQRVADALPALTPLQRERFAQVTDGHAAYRRLKQTLGVETRYFLASYHGHAYKTFHVQTVEVEQRSHNSPRHAQFRPRTTGHQYLTAIAPWYRGYIVVSVISCG